MALLRSCTSPMARAQTARMAQPNAVKAQLTDREPEFEIRALDAAVDGQHLAGDIARSRREKRTAAAMSSGRPDDASVCRRAWRRSPGLSTMLPARSRSHLGSQGPAPSARSCASSRDGSAPPGGAVGAHPWIANWPAFMRRSPRTHRQIRADEARRVGSDEGAGDVEAHRRSNDRLLVSRKAEGRPPTLLTTMSTRPNSAMAVSTRTACRRSRSPATVAARRPCASTAAVLRRAGRRNGYRRRRRHRLGQTAATAAPIPRPRR